MNILRGLLGIAVLIGLALAMSNNRKKVNWILVAKGIALQLIFAAFILKTSIGITILGALNEGIASIISMSDKGAEFVFGETFRDHFVAFSVSSTIIFLSALMSVLFFYRIIQFIVKWMARGIMFIIPVSGVEALAACANVFIGMTEAPLVIRPYLAKMTHSELNAMLVGGMATISGGMLAVYVGLGADAGFLIAASLMAAPASLVVAKIMIPETETPDTLGQIRTMVKSDDVNVFQAICKGAGDGLMLALNILAMLIAFVAIAALLNMFMGLFPDVNGEPLSVERILGWLFAPLAFVIGVDWQDAIAVGALLGKKMFLNEFLAYLDMVVVKETLQAKSTMIATIALCGFANFGAIGIQIGGIGSMVEGRKAEIAKMSLKAMLGGTLVSLLTAAMAGMFF